MARVKSIYCLYLFLFQQAQVLSCCTISEMLELYGGTVQNDVGGTGDDIAKWNEMCERHREVEFSSNTNKTNKTEENVQKMEEPSNNRAGNKHKSSKLNRQQKRRKTRKHVHIKKLCRRKGFLRRKKYGKRSRIRICNKGKIKTGYTKDYSIRSH